MPEYIDYSNIDRYLPTESEYWGVNQNTVVTTTLQNAIDGCPNNLKVSTGNYFLSDEIIIQNKTDFRLHFENVSILIESTKTLGYIFKFLNNTNIEVTGKITVKTQIANQLTCYYIQDCKDSRFEGLQCNGVNDTFRFLRGIQVEYATNHTNYQLYTLTFDDCLVRYSQYGFVNNEINVSLDSSRFYNCSINCVQQEYKNVSGNNYSVVGFNIHKCVFKNSRKGIYILGFPQSPQSNVRSIISNCVFDYLTVCGIHIKEYSFDTLICNNTFTGIFSNPTSYTPLTLAEAVSLNSVGYRYGIYMEGSQYVSINNNEFYYTDYYIGIHGCQNIQINSNRFSNSTFITLASIREMDAFYNVGNVNITNNNIFIVGNSFYNSIFGNPFSALHKDIQLFTITDSSKFNQYYKYKINSNFSSVARNYLNYSSVSPTNNTYRLDATYEGLMWDLYISQTNRPLIFHSSLLGNDFTVNCYSSVNSNAYYGEATWSSNLTTPPSNNLILCNGVSYDSVNRKFIFTQLGVYLFRHLEEDYVGFVVTSSNNPSYSLTTGLNGNLSVSNANVLKMNYLKNDATQRTVTFNPMPSDTKVGFYFYFTSTSNNNGTLIQNSTGYDIFIQFTKNAGKTQILNGFSLLINSAEAYHTYKCIYLGETVANSMYWVIHQT